MTFAEWFEARYQGPNDGEDGLRFLLKEAWDAARAEERLQWIPCSERFPDQEDNVLFYTPKSQGLWIGNVNMEDQMWYDSYDDLKVAKLADVSHWMPVPSLPSPPRLNEPKGLPSYPLEHAPGCEWPACDCDGRWACQPQRGQE